VQVIILILLVAALLIGGPECVSSQGEPVRGQTIEDRIPPPLGYTRIPAGERSFGAWLRRLPLRPGRSEVRLYDGHPKANQDAHYAVVDLDIGDKDLQQCADAIIRLRAEYLFSVNCAVEIHFDFTNGQTAYWTAWRDGMRFDERQNTWRRTAQPDTSHGAFRGYLDCVFNYAGTASLERELLPVGDPSKPELGDVFIQGGSPGHAVLVVDVAINAEGESAFLLAQSYMPAQDIHVLESFDDIRPWYRARRDGVLRTPEWSFEYGDLRRFRGR